MLFVSVKKYNALQLSYRREQEKNSNQGGMMRELGKEIFHLQSLRTLDKECIKALLNLLVEHEIPLSTFEDSLVDQTLNQ